ncbi:MAG: flavodoxin [Spirochaetales bacterium]|nr:flavodoxin [Spirochaetales bacterium]
MSKVLIIYGSSTGATEDIAGRIADRFDGAASRNVTSLEGETIASLKTYDLVLLGSSTWGIGDLQDDWYAKLDILAGADLKGVKVGVFGTGDQESYPDSFADAVGILAETAERAGATIIGHTDTTDYAFDESRAARDGALVGLAVDEDNQSDKTDGRIEAWVASLKAAL